MNSEKKITTFVLIGIFAAIIIAMFVSPFASSNPDGLDKVAESYGFVEKAKNVISDKFFLIPDYSFKPAGDSLWQTSLSGLFGVLIVLAIFGIIFLIYKADVKNKKSTE